MEDRDEDEDEVEVGMDEQDTQMEGMFPGLGSDRDEKEVDSQTTSKRRLDLPPEEAKIYFKPDYGNQDKKSKVYKKYQEQIKERTFNDYNKFDIKNFDVKTDGTLVGYKPEFHKPRVRSN
eukprot:CAMPEP_0205806382 /NCGR_PEP_ID=MMETSP0205-20121125/9938_1 /ASSEMBLY_ACC=CAM_ASM_000278 /TAXON_ID=36767 /ORGANISM="Euplotes focardii, Strain TN1" /LENGTH=119 /DNA_ID=CAMNT_0053079209 /DNA_START=527 /DNA_END=883 /DNA_ORIENTATION=+